MADIEKVIKGLECCAKDDCSSKTCPYGEEDTNNCIERLSADALELLKEQEAKTGHWIDSAGDDKCSVCGATYSDLYPDYGHTHYCPNCGAKMIGQAVKWE